MSTSSESDTDTPKRPHLVGVMEGEEESVSVRDLLADIKQRMVTKEDIQDIKQEIKELTKTLTERIEQLEGRVFEAETKLEVREEEMKKLRKENETLKNCVKANEPQLRSVQRDQNDLQQYSRRWNVRVFRVPEEKNETAEDCARKCVDIFCQKLQVKTEVSDIEIAHRTGKPGSGDKPRPILVRLFDRKKRDEILANRKKMKNKGLVIAEDLTFANYRVYSAAAKHSACMNAWTSNGKIFAKMKNGQVLKLDMHTDVSETFKRAMNG